MICPYVTVKDEIDGLKPYYASRPRDKLAIGLLGANKQIRAEAANILFGSNTWYLGYPSVTLDPTTFHDSIWITHLDKFRKIRVAFDWGDLSQEERVSYIFECSLGDESAEPPSLNDHNLV